MTNEDIDAIAHLGSELDKASWYKSYPPEDDYDFVIDSDDISTEEG